MATKLIYQLPVKLLSWIVLRARSDTTKEIEILVLRHQLAVLQRRTPRPRISWSDRAVIAALARLLLVRRRHGFLVTPATILSRHRKLVRRRWTTPGSRPGRPAIPTGARALTVRLAIENPTRGYRRVHGELVAANPRQDPAAAHPRRPDKRVLGSGLKPLVIAMADFWHPTG